MIGRSCSARPSPWPNWSPKASISFGNPNSSAVRPDAGELSVVTPGLTRAIAASIHSRALLVGVALRARGAADVERPVIAGAVAVERLDDVEEGLVARADQPVREVVRVRAATLAGDGVDRLHVVGALAVQVVVRRGDHLVLPDARLQDLGDQLVAAVDHGGRHRQQHDLVVGLHLPGVEHHLLGVDAPGCRHARGPGASAAPRCPRRPERRRPRRRRGGPSPPGRRRPSGRRRAATGATEPSMPARELSGSSHGAWRRW